MADLGAIGKDEGNGHRFFKLVGGWDSMNSLGSGPRIDAIGKSQSLATSSTTSVVGASLSIR